jgi:superfamily II DNA or RNA helicase
MIQGKTKKTPTSSSRPARLSHTAKPAEMTLEEWQRNLRMNAGKTGSFLIKNIGTHPVYSDFSVRNRQNNNSYKVSIRSGDGSMNFCECNDFKTNGLGTCKHIESVIDHLEKDLITSGPLGSDDVPSYSSMYVKYGTNRDVRVRIGSAHKVAYRKLFGKYCAQDGVLSASAYGHIEVILRKAKAISEDFRCYPDALDHILTVRERERRYTLLDTLFPRRGNSARLDRIIKIKMFPYQKAGVYFALRAGRCLIADEMGLGKTVQAIAAAEMLKKYFHAQRVVIVCPTSLKYQWKKEIARFTKSSLTVIEGGYLSRKKQYAEESYYKVISYNVVGSDIDSINGLGPDLVILDEAQRIKNWNAKISRHVKKIDAPHAIVLTGTPLENKLEELVSIVQFVDTFKLGPLYKFLHDHQIKDDTGKVVGYKNLNKIGTVLEDIVLRRTKHEVMKQLPPRMDKNLFVPMTEAQADLHREYSDVVAKLVAKWKSHHFLDEKDRRRLMIHLNLMRMVCDSTYIVDQETRHDTKIAEVMSILDDTFQSADQKVVIFSQWERMTRLVEEELTKRSIGFEYLHGGIPSKAREALYQNFNNDAKVKVFLSTDAGGVGLNLQAGSLMINLDLPWNPAVLEQRIGRIHRYGQTRPVNIINLISAGTIEERMLTLLQFKSSVAKGVLDAGDDQIFMGESKFKQFMKSVESITTATESDHPARRGTSLTDEEEKGIERESSGLSGKNIESTPSESAAALLVQGAKFLTALGDVMKDQESMKNFIASVVRKDESTGKSYLTIPVENEKIIEDALNAFAGFLKNVQKK